ncbi:MAG: hypothetical protein K6U80_14880 [Firmicutes bacterium]|nr:hypothetical protein [Bacillota bacterium]
MNLIQTIFELAQKYPERKPGSTAQKEVFAAIKQIAAAWGVYTESQKIPVYCFQTSLRVFIIGSIVAALLSFVGPGWGLLLSLGLYWMFIRELVHPLLAKVNAVSGENLLIHIPARSKENQKIILTTNISGDSFLEPPPAVSPRLYLILVYGLGLLAPVFLFLYWRLRIPSLLFFTAIPVCALVFLSWYTRKTAFQDSGLDKAAVLLELGAVLLKSGVLSTSVTLFFTGSKSLNSGILPVLQLLKSSGNENGPLTYVINLMDLPDKRINVVTACGELVSRPSDPLLTDVLMEISREKNIPTQEIRLQQFTETYPLKFKKIMTVALTHPQDQYIGGNANRDLRELLLGLIRKLD